MTEISRRTMLKEAVAASLSALTLPKLTEASQSLKDLSGPSLAQLDHDYVQNYFNAVRQGWAVIDKNSDPRVVKALQMLLNEVGGGPRLEVDGDFGPKTTGRLKGFQESERLKADAVVGPATMAAFDRIMYPGGQDAHARIRPDYSMAVVDRIQKGLQAAINPHLDVDGRFGEGTEYWLAVYQLSRGLNPTGRIDQNVLEALASGKPRKEMDYKKLPRFTQRGYLNGRPYYFTARRLGSFIMREETAEAFVKMLDAALDEDVQIDISEAFRTYEKQERFYNDYCRDPKKNPLAARPGHSRHEWGGALDLRLGEKGEALGWLAENAEKFGFEARLKNEWWHWELKGSHREIKRAMQKTVED